MKRVKSYKGYVIAKSNEKERIEGKSEYQVFTAEEWAYGEGCRYPEFDDCCSIAEAISNIDCCTKPDVPGRRSSARNKKNAKKEGES